MEKRIISLENGVVTVEEVKTLKLSDADISAKEQELATRKLGAETAIVEANKELEKIAQEEKELTEAKAIMAEAYAKFPVNTAELSPMVQDVLPIPNGEF